MLNVLWPPALKQHESWLLKLKRNAWNEVWTTFILVRGSNQICLIVFKHLQHIARWYCYRVNVADNQRFVRPTFTNQPCHQYYAGRHPLGVDIRRRWFRCHNVLYSMISVYSEYWLNSWKINLHAWIGLNCDFSSNGETLFSQMLLELPILIDFTRVGLTMIWPWVQSTFMVEMAEANDALRKQLNFLNSLVCWWIRAVMQQPMMVWRGSAIIEF